MELKYLKYEVSEQGIAIITLQNPPLNLLSVPMAVEIRELFVENLLGPFKKDYSALT